MNNAIKKILHFHFGKDGGAERFFVNLVNAFGDKGIEQKFVIRPNRSWRNEIEALGNIYENHNRQVSLSQFILKYRMNRLVEKWQPQVVMAWMPRAGSLIKNWTGPSKVVRLGDFPKKLSYFKNCDLIVGNLPAIEERCQKLGWQKQTAVISNFAREVKPVAIARSKYDTPEDAYLIAGAGRFVRRKGMDLLVDCLKHLPDAYLWLIGNGEETKSLEARAREAGVFDRIRFIGWVDEPIHYIAAADVFGMPSRHEPLGNLALEAWQAQVPVVSTRSEGPSWYMRDGVDGLLVNIDATKDFAQKLIAIRDDESMAKNLVQGGLERLADWFSREKVVQAYLEKFAEVHAARKS